MLLHLTNIWLAGNKLAFFLIQASKRGESATEDFSTWGSTQKMKWPGLLMTIVIGLVAGALARPLIPGRDPMRIIVTIILGIAGSFVGGIIAGLIWRNETGVFRPGAFLLSVLGAVLLLFLWRTVRRNYEG